MDKFKIEKPYGPKPLRKLFQQVADAINLRTPKKGFGTEIQELADGFRINTVDRAKQDEAIVPDDGNGGTGVGGAASDLEGALNGQPATYHLSQTADPTPRT